MRTLLVLLITVTASPTWAQPSIGTIGEPAAPPLSLATSLLHHRDVSAELPLNSHRRALMLPVLGAVMQTRFEPAAQQSSARRQRTGRQKAVGAIVGGAAGFFGGLFVGAAIEGNRCSCDDPGLVGALIGAPIGAVAGSVLGYKFLF